MAKRGGKRENAGRKKNEPDADSIKVGKGFASRIFDRLPELKLPNIHNAEDFGLQILALGPTDATARIFFKDLLLWRLGKPVQPVITADTRESAPELNFDGLRMPDVSTQLKKAGKPN